MSRGIGSTFESDLGRVILTRVAKDATAKNERFRMRLQRKRSVEGEQSAIAIAESVSCVAELVPG
jgi:hypothetical protein